MTQDEIVLMAKEADLWLTSDERIAAVVRFAALVAAAERNKVAQWMIDRGYATGHGDTVEDLLKEFEWQIRERTVKECIRLCDQVDLVGADECMDNIREHFGVEK